MDYFVKDVEIIGSLYYVKHKGITTLHRNKLHGSKIHC